MSTAIPRTDENGPRSTLAVALTVQRLQAGGGAGVAAAIACQACKFSNCKF